MDEITAILETCGLRGVALDEAVSAVSRFGDDRYNDGYSDGYDDGWSYGTDTGY